MNQLYLVKQLSWREVYLLASSPEDACKKFESIERQLNAFALEPQMLSIELVSEARSVDLFMLRDGRPVELFL